MWATRRRASWPPCSAPSLLATWCFPVVALVPRRTTTRQCAAKALGVELALHPRAEALIRERMQDIAREQGVPYEPDRSDNVHRLNMGMFPAGAEIIPNPFNKIPGFYCRARHDSGFSAAGPSPGATAPLGGVYFLPGFPVMAWPMMEWVLDTYYRPLFHAGAWLEQSVIVFGAMEATLTPLMQDIEAAFPGVKVFSLPSVDHPEYGRHIELGVKGEPVPVAAAYQMLLAGLRAFKVSLGPELVQKLE